MEGEQRELFPKPIPPPSTLSCVNGLIPATLELE